MAEFTGAQVNEVPRLVKSLAAAVVASLALWVVLLWPAVQWVAK